MKGGMGGQAVALAHGTGATCGAALRHAILSCWAAQVVLASCDIIAAGKGPHLVWWGSRSTPSWHAPQCVVRGSGGGGWAVLGGS